MYGPVLEQPNTDGSLMKTIIESKDRNLSEFDSENGGTFIFAADAPSHPSELFLLQEVKMDNLQRLTVSNPWLDDVALGKQEVVTWNAEDGMKLQGLLIYPLNYQEGKRYPLFTLVHGGPESHYDFGWLTDYSDPG